MHSNAALPAVRERARQWQERGRDVRLLGREEVAALTGCDRYVAGYLDPTGGGLNPLSLARGLAAAAQEMGARLYTDSPALSIEADGKGWKVKTGRGVVRCDQVVVATGAYSEQSDPRTQAEHSADAILADRHGTLAGTPA